MIVGKFQRNIVHTMQIRTAVSGDDYARARELFREYVKTPGVEVCVVGFEEELAKLETKYFAVLLAWEAGEAVGCGALRELGEGRVEMKRLFLRPEARGLKMGRALVSALIERAREQGGRMLLLDTLPSMQSAIAMYQSLGFEQIDSYSAENPADALCFSLRLAE
jgi:ribosomal protein S18 acetylase RimI-like enzyme